MISIDTTNTHLPVKPTHGLGVTNYEQDPDATANREILQNYFNSQEAWAREAQMNMDYYDNLHYTEDQIKILGQRGQAAVPINIITPATEMAIALLTSRNPTWQATGRDDSDRKMADVMSDLASYIWQKNRSNEKLKSAIYDAYTTSRGVIRAWVDPHADLGKGEIRYDCLDPIMVFPDPNSRDRYWRDASNIMVYNVLTREQVENLWPEAAGMLQGLASTHDTFYQNKYRPGKQRANTADGFTSGVAIDNNHEHFELIERYTKVKMPYYRVYEVTEDKEFLFLEDELMEYIQEPAFIMEQGGEQTFIVENSEVQQAALLYDEGIPLADNIRLIEGQTQEGPDGQPVELPAFTLQLATNEDMISIGVIELAHIMVNRIKFVSTINDRVFQRMYLPMEEYPIVPLHFRHFRDPYPKSDLAYVRPLQDTLNNLWSKNIANLATLNNLKILFAKGSIKKETLEREMSKSGVAAIEYKPEQGVDPPIFAPAQGLPATITQQMNDVVGMIERNLGVYSVMQGDPGQTHTTHKGIVAIDEMGQRRIASKQKDLEGFLNQLGTVVCELVPFVYNQRRIVRVTQSNNEIKETVINDWMVDDDTQAISKVNDITTGRYDLVIISGSMLPTNRMQEAEIYKELYLVAAQAGLPIAEPMLTMMLKKLDVPELEEMMEKSGAVVQAQQQIQMASKRIEELEGDLQTRERELYHARVQVELAKAKANITGEVEKMRKAAQLYENRSQDMQEMDKTITDYERKLRLAANTGA